MRAALALLLAGTLACAGAPPTPGTPGVPPATCAGACAHAARLACAAGTPACVGACEVGAQEGIDWPLACLVRAPTCADFEACPRD